jgi:hypothetical protein
VGAKDCVVSHQLIAQLVSGIYVGPLGECVVLDDFGPYRLAKGLDGLDLVRSPAAA